MKSLKFLKISFLIRERERGGKPARHKYIFRFILLFITLIFLYECSGGIPDDILASASSPTLRPNKFPDETPTERIYYDGRAVLTFRYTKEDIGNIPEEEWGNVEIRFHIEAVDSERGNPADNVVNGNYTALVNGTIQTIPRPVGRLSYYTTTLSPGQKEVSVEYIASDVSGVYKIVGEAYYRGELKGKKDVVVEVKIPDLVEFSRVGYDSSNNMIWRFGGETQFHTRNNYVQQRVGLALANLLNKIKSVYAENNQGDNGFIVRITDASLPWGGMFWIGYTKNENLTIQRVDGYGNYYDITYRAGIDNRIYAPPHREHRDGRHIDISVYSDDGNGGIDMSRHLEEGDLRDAIMESGGYFSVYDEITHYHLTCSLGENYYY